MREGFVSRQMNGMLPGYPYHPEAPAAANARVDAPPQASPAKGSGLLCGSTGEQQLGYLTALSEIQFSVLVKDFLAASSRDGRLTADGKAC